jgi:hypothetical protein
MPTEQEELAAFRRSLPWGGALGHLEQNHPRELAKLLRSGKLVERLDQLAENWWLMENRLEKQLPKATQEERYEVVNGEIFPSNLQAHRERPLNQEEERLLEAFREKHGV